LDIGYPFGDGGEPGVLPREISHLRISLQVSEVLGGFDEQEGEGVPIPLGEIPVEGLVLCSDEAPVEEGRDGWGSGREGREGGELLLEAPDAPLISFSASAEDSALRVDLVVPAETVRTLIGSFGAMRTGPAPEVPSENFEEDLE